MHTVECFAQRLLNPFRGAVHTIKYASAEAATLDGVQWDIYVANEQLLDDLQVSRWTQVSDIRYGKWSAEAGLKRGPIYPSDDFRRMEDMGAMVYQHLTRVHQRIPFAFKDHYELWLLDTESRPLALLDSALAEQRMELDQNIEWRAGMAAQAGFASPAMPALDQTGNAADYLTRHINGRAGKEPMAQWFCRNPDGSGSGLGGIRLSRGLEGRTLAAEAFPVLMVSRAGQDAAHQQLIEDFHAWQAPWLLVLTQIDVATRQALEQKAREQAPAVFKLYRLYPQVIDQMGIKAALVEAVMLRSQSAPQAGRDETMPTYYIEQELNPGPVD